MLCQYCRKGYDNGCPYSEDFVPENCEYFAPL